jgi:molecular chaperone GrpE (heat shock protein)
MESHNKNLKNALDLPDDVESIPKVFERKKTEIQKHVGEKTEKDYLQVRDNLFDLLESSKDAIEGIMSVAMAGDQPRAYEVVATLLKVTSDINKDIMEVHRKMKETTKESETKNVTNNAFFVGSTSDLAKMIQDQTDQVKKVSSKVKKNEAD